MFVLTGLVSYAGLYDNYTQLLAVPVQGFLSWMLLRWLASNLSSNGRPLRVAFNGDPLTFIGWQILFSASIFTIIGWAWVATAWMRWNLRHITGTRREVVFNATGLGLLWRTIVFAIACGLVIPIPWALHWFAGWMVSQVELVERGPLRSA